MDDSADFDAFYNATNRRVLHQVYAMTGDLAAARDCTHEAYARAWRRWTTVSRATSPEAWIRTVAWRLAGSRWRRTRNGLSRAREGNADLISALRRLPEKQRYAIVLCHLAGLSIGDIALETGASTATVETRLSRGRATLTRLLPDTTMIPSGGSRD